MKPTRDGMILWAEQEAEKYRTVKAERLVDRMIPTPDELERGKRAIDSIADDGWKGPEERPEEIGEWIKCHYNIGGKSYATCVRYDVHDWSDIICWQPIEIGPMPERFKKEVGDGN